MSDSKVVIKGISQKGLLGGTLKISANGTVVAEVAKNAVIEIPITSDTAITARCGVNKCNESVLAKAGEVTEIEYTYDKSAAQIVPIVNGSSIEKQPVIAEATHDVSPKESVSQSVESVQSQTEDKKSRSTVAMIILSVVIATFLGVVSAMVPTAGIFLMVLYGIFAGWATYMFLSEIVASAGVRVLIGIIVGIVLFFFISWILSFYSDPFSPISIWLNETGLNAITVFIAVLPLTVLWFIPTFVLAKSL